MRERQVHTMAVIRQWVLALGGAGLLCAVAQCLMPSKAMEKQLRLVLSLVLLCLFFGVFGKVSAQQMQDFSMEEQQAMPQEQQQVTQQGVLLLTRLELARLIEQTLLEQTGSSFTVSAIGLSQQDGEVTVQEVALASLQGRDPQELADILSRQLDLSVTVSEVNGQ